MRNTPSHIRDFGGYVFFSSRTSGHSGYPVKIHTDLFIDFCSSVEPNTNEGETVIRQIESLTSNARNCAMPKPARNYDNLHFRKGKEDPRKKKLDALYNRMEEASKVIHKVRMREENTLVTKNVRIKYRLFQADGDKCPTVYISEVRIVRGGSPDLVGFYELRSSATKARYTQNNDCNLDGKEVFISGASTGISQAAASANAATKNSNPMLFFNPMTVTDDLSMWKEKRITKATEVAIKKLEEGIRRNKKSKVNWYVEGEGAAVLSKALSRVNDNLESHSFKFSDINADLPKLLQDLTQRKAQLKGEFINMSGSKAARMAFAAHGQALAEVVSGLPCDGGYESITRRYLVERVKALASNRGINNTIFAESKNLRGSTTATFVSALKLMRTK